MQIPPPSAPLSCDILAWECKGAIFRSQGHVSSGVSIGKYLANPRMPGADGQMAPELRWQGVGREGSYRGAFRTSGAGLRNPPVALLWTLAADIAGIPRWAEQATQHPVTTSTITHTCLGI